ncbi:SurA N-terminal domain-containing protein [Psittacicella gerlachiana]|uniref:Periplasmic chaperone PpiD n=1 Tax=Psittacicella gerlachiana TaxID=2028574 RepID=A0A3A1YEB0_9GAMM|nr:SurA N-terminal domain-containing protein [Psittacicella gerlachiana]RIY34534.1 hypothetical protein CKF59_05370 [Psittacicella gerlachiana]
MIGKFNSVQKSFIFKLLPVAIAVPFILQTISGSNLGTAQQNYLVTFSDKNVGITYNEFQQAYQSRYNQLLQSYGQERFAEIMTSENEKLLRQTVLDSLINDRLRLLYSEKIGVRVTDNDIIQNIRDNQMFHGADGKYSEDRIRAFLNYYGLTTEQYFSLVANQLRDETVNNLLNNAYIITPKEVEINASLALPTAYVQVAQVAAASDAEAITPTEQQVQEYYDLHRDNYAIPAKATLSYIRYNRSSLATKAPKPTEEQLKEYYDKNPQLFSSTTYNLSNIVVDDQKTADQVLEALNNGMSFVEAVKEYSTDVASRFNEGSLGNLTQAQLPAYVKDVVPLMNEHSHSNIIKDADGKFHIFYLNSKTTSTTSFADAKAQITQTLTELNQQTYLQNLFAQVNEIVESNGNIAEVAKVLGLEVSKTQSFTAKTLPESVPSDIARLAFTGDMTVNQVNSPQGIADSQDEIITQLDSFQDTIYPTLEEIKDKVTADTKLSLAQQQNLAKLQELATKLNDPATSAEQAQELLAQAKVTLGAETEVSMLGPTPEQEAYFNALFTSKYKGNQVDYLVVNDEKAHKVYLLGVHGFTVDPQVNNNLLSQFVASYEQQVSYDYDANLMQDLRKVYKVKVNYDLLGSGS